MKKIILLLVLLFGSIVLVMAQRKAVTEMGEEVILYDDGTWAFEQEQSQNTEGEALEIPMNKKTFEKATKATFLLKSKNMNVGIWLNPKKWSFQKATENPDAEYEFQLKGEDLYGMLISEKIEIPLETLRNIAFENARSIASDLTVVKEEYRMVNNQKVLFMQMNGTMQGIKFSYYGYYFSNERGTAQLITYTSQNLLAEYRQVCDTFLNGLIAF